jgi:hypothetical protein
MHDELARNAIDLLEEILDEQLEHEPDFSHRLAGGLMGLAMDGLENRVMEYSRANELIEKCAGLLGDTDVEYL